MPRPAPAREPRLFHEDVVVRRADAAPSPSQLANLPAGAPGECGVVVRAWHDEEALPPPPASEAAGVDRALIAGELGVAWYPSATREIVREEQLQLWDRAFQVGDVARRSGEAGGSTGSGSSSTSTAGSTGIVTDVAMTLTLAHVLSGQRLADVPAAHVANALRVLVGDHVVHARAGWVGVVEEVFEEGIVQSSVSTDLVRVCDVGSRLSVGEKQQGGELEAASAASAWSAFFAPRRAPPQPVVNTVLSVKQTLIAVNWLALSQRLSPAEQDARPRPKRFWDADMAELTLVRSFSEHAHAVGDKVIFRTPELAAQHGLEETQHGPDGSRVAVGAMNVVSTSSAVSVLWQDGSSSVEKSTSLVPHLNLDEHDVWPGDFVLHRPDADADDGGAASERVGVVQSMDARERTAVLRIYGSDTTEAVPVLELDVHGPETAAFGLHRGDTVLIASQPTGVLPPALPRLGELEEMPEDEELRAEMSHLGMAYAQRFDKECPLVLPAAPSEGIDWYGSVTGISPAGLVQIRLPSGSTVEEKYEHLSLLVDGFEDDDGGWDDDASSEYETDSEDEVMWTTEDGEEVPREGPDLWEDMDVEEEDELVDEEVQPRAAPAAPEPPVPEPEAPPPAAATPSTSAAADEPQASTSAVPAFTPALASVPQAAGASMPVDARWERFAILEEAPADHAFLKEKVEAPKKAFFSRLQKEFKILQNSLPDSILVRSYEDRQDLLRVLIIGSEGTPYEDAPVLIDFALKADYPHSPPVAHYHSWTSGDRISPNLYHDGKVCLSLLGTWAGEKSSESWNPSKSSLLQLFVSIQALVLVTKPYFTEPSLERTAGTSEAELNSRLYNEKSYILSRAFVRRALEHPVQGLETELSYFYYGDATHPSRLRRVIERAQKLLVAVDARGSAAEEEEDQKEASSTVDEPAVTRLSGGGAIILRRSLAALQRLADAHAA